MKRYLDVNITTHSGQVINNPLKLSEAHLISKIAQENSSCTVRYQECEDRVYKLIFSK